VKSLKLTWDQVNAWRLARHGLAPRVAFMEAVQRMIGVQAQVMSAAELSIGARVDGLTRADVQRALWQDRTLVKTWAMRNWGLPRRSTTSSCWRCLKCLATLEMSR
jgi:DNA glycosylase AlkZ-like